MRTTARPTAGCDIDPRARLIDGPRSLHELCDECEFGVGDDKPAKDFNSQEINQQGQPFKNKHWRRMKIWRIQRYCINKGLNVAAANQLITDVHGTDKITSLIIIITRYQKTDSYPCVGQQRFHPRLCRGNV